jgi:2'-5' RNA ligase
MSDPKNAKDAGYANSEELERFRSIRWLHNHWSRPVGPPAYYWYLTFEKSPELHNLARRCQEALAFPYYDLTPLRDLHLTLDRIAYATDIAPGKLDAIEAAAIRACQKIRPFSITIGSLGGTPGAIGFTAFPGKPVEDLRDTFRAATLSVYPGAPIRPSGFHPHVTIAYANSDGVPATEAISVVEKLHSAATVNITIREGILALLERRQRAYEWRTFARIPLAG